VSCSSCSVTTPTPTKKKEEIQQVAFFSI